MVAKQQIWRGGVGSVWECADDSLGSGCGDQQRRQRERKLDQAMWETDDDSVIE